MSIFGIFRASLAFSRSERGFHFGGGNSAAIPRHGPRHEKKGQFGPISVPKRP